MSQPSTTADAYGNCPHCQHLVKVPIDAKPRCEVRCPHCEADFLLHQLLDLTVPTLKIVDGASEESKTTIDVPLVDRVLFNEEGEPRKKFVVPPQLAKGAKRRRRGSREKSGSSSASAHTTDTIVDEVDAVSIDTSNHRPSSISTPATSTETSSADMVNEDILSSKLGADIIEVKLRSSSSSGSNRKHQKSRNGKKSTRSRRKKSRSYDDFDDDANPKLEFIKMLFGGILAFPLAYSILLWIFLQDPLGIAQPIGKVAPFAVPTVYRPKPDLVPKIERSSVFDLEPDTFDPQPFTPNL